MLDDEDFGDSDSEFEDDDPERICALQRRTPEETCRYLPVAEASSPVALKNKYAALASDACGLDDDINALAQWAPVTYKKKRLPPAKQLDTFERVVVHSEADLEALLARNPRLAALPEPTKKIKNMLKSRPVELECGPDEVLCLVGSGSTVNAANIAKHFPA